METVLMKMIEHVKEALPELSYVDEDCGQLEALDESTDQYPVTFPCVLIGDFATDWTDLAFNGGVQRGETTCTVRLAIDCYDDTYAGSGTEDRIAERQLLARKLYVALQCMAFNDDMGPMNRVKSRDYSLPGGVKVYEMQMEFEEKDDSAMR